MWLEGCSFEYSGFWACGKCAMDERNNNSACWVCSTIAFCLGELCTVCLSVVFGTVFVVVVVVVVVEVVEEERVVAWKGG